MPSAASPSALDVVFHDLLRCVVPCGSTTLRVLGGTFSTGRVQAVKPRRLSPISGSNVRVFISFLDVCLVLYVQIFFLKKESRPLVRSCDSINFILGLVLVTQGFLAEEAVTGLDGAA